jgi:hypothetical protein
VAEWLRSGLQSRLHRFDSGRRLLLDAAQLRRYRHLLLGLYLDPRDPAAKTLTALGAGYEDIDARSAEQLGKMAAWPHAGPSSPRAAQCAATAVTAHRQHAAR